MVARRIALAVLCASLWTGAGASRAADPAPAAITVTGPGRSPPLTDAMMVALPTTKATAPAGTVERTFEGPLLWSVLMAASVADPAKFHGHVRDVVTITGHDGYTAILALGELSPEFGSKPVILATQMDGQPLGAGHLRVLVPGDKHGGRGVHDVAAISLEARL